MANKKTHSKIHATALERFNLTHSGCIDERELAVSDRRFYSLAGAQWEGTWGEQFENKPKIEVNKIHLSVIRIFNEYRNNRITADFVSKDGMESEGLADTCDELYRADEQRTDGEAAYDNAFEEAVGGGFGAWRLVAEYVDEEDDENEEQRISFEPIYDADTSVFFDLDAKKQDKSDANYCFVISSMTKAAYEEQYDDTVSSWPKATDTNAFNWCDVDVVYVAEYYTKKKIKKTVNIFTHDVLEEEHRYTDAELADDSSIEELMTATGFSITRKKTVTKTRVFKYILSGGGVLEDCGEIAGANIPIIPVFGKRWFVDNAERFMGHVRLAKDSQRLKNIQLSRLAETAALSPVEKPIFTPEQVAGHENLWSEDNVENYPYMLLNPMMDKDGNEMPAGAVGYTKPPAVPPALATLLQLTDQDMQAVLGNQEAGEEIIANTSGKAVELVQTRLDMQTYIYMSNMAKAVKRCGEVWLGMAREIFVEDGRKLKTVTKDGKPGGIVLGEKIMTESGETVGRYDLSRANFDVNVEVGPTSSSKRSATVRALTGVMGMTQDPETMQILSAMVMMNMEGEGVGDVREHFRRKLVQMGVVKPTDEELAEMKEAASQPQQPNPNDIFLMAEAEKSKAQADKARADTEKVIAETAETRVDTVKTLTDIDRDDRVEAVAIAEKMAPAPRQPNQPFLNGRDTGS